MKRFTIVLMLLALSSVGFAKGDIYVGVGSESMRGSIKQYWNDELYGIFTQDGFEHKLHSIGVGTKIDKFDIVGTYILGISRTDNISSLSVRAKANIPNKNRFGLYTMTEYTQRLNMSSYWRAKYVDDRRLDIGLGVASSAKGSYIDFLLYTDLIKSLLAITPIGKIGFFLKVGYRY